jgi:hypothetical protein
MGCNIANFSIKYLGLQMALRPLTRSEWQPMLDGVTYFIPPWQRGMIARASHFILIKTVIYACPIHHILVAGAPDWLLEEVARLSSG